MTASIRHLLESTIAVATIATIIAACNLPFGGSSVALKRQYIHLITLPDVCDTIVTDNRPQQVCTEVTHVR